MQAEKKWEDFVERPAASKTRSSWLPHMGNVWVLLKALFWSLLSCCIPRKAEIDLSNQSENGWSQILLTFVRYALSGSFLSFSPRSLFLAVLMLTFFHLPLADSLPSYYILTSILPHSVWHHFWIFPSFLARSHPVSVSFLFSLCLPFRPSVWE